MENILDILSTNKEWIFSGVGLTGLSGILWIVKLLFFSKSEEAGNQETSENKILKILDSNVSGNVAGKDITSTAINIAGDYVVNSNQSPEKLIEDQYDLRFIIRLDSSAQIRWSEVSGPPKLEMLPSFEEDCRQFFKLVDIAPDFDPKFDITILNKTNSVLVICKIGIEVSSVAHHMLAHGEPEASEILQQAEYVLFVPDIRNEVDPGKLLKPTAMNRDLIIDIPSLFRMDIDSTFCYSLLLKNYIINMPNCSVLRFIIETESKTYKSSYIHMFTL